MILTMGNAIIRHQYTVYENIILHETVALIIVKMLIQSAFKMVVVSKIK